MQDFLVIAEEVADALAEGRGVVALESTIISHGMPYPDNLMCAQRLESIVRNRGAVPVTMATHDGKFLVGLAAEQLEELAEVGQVARKVSRRDIASALASRTWGATTVAGTMIGAHAAGIKIFATGGIGGVHRGAELTFDVSADLTELGRTPVAVICAGAKSILDLPKTIEVLETQGVPILGWQCDEFPSFFSRSSGLPLEDRFDDMHSLTHCLQQHFDCAMQCGLLVVNPVPVDKALAKEDENRWIEQALTEAKDQGISGKKTTPFLLGRLVELSDGKTLEANLALVENNVDLAALMANEAT